MNVESVQSSSLNNAIHVQNATVVATVQTMYATTAKIASMMADCKTIDDFVAFQKSLESLLPVDTKEPHR